MKKDGSRRNSFRKRDCSDKLSTGDQVKSSDDEPVQAVIFFTGKQIDVQCQKCSLNSTYVGESQYNGLLTRQI